VPFADLSDYRASLTNHRPWPATIGLFALGVIAWAGVLIVLESIGLIGLGGWPGWLLAAVLSVVSVVADAAHRIAGGRMSRHR
jgi:hypothetical protein